MSYYPIFLDIKGKRCVVIGGGTVALRKVNMLLDHGASVELISPEICTEISELAKSSAVKTRHREYQHGDLEGASAVIAATNDSDVNEKIANEATERGILINVVDVPRLSSFIVPSYLRRGDLTIAVSTGGKSPALARKIRSELEKSFREEYAILVSLIEEVRSELMDRGIRVSPKCWQQALDLQTLLELLRSGQRSQAKKQLLNSLEEA
ncbi:MAG: bifunctional precorrin-2 dehydrogenase/sirohydrochlorin ferrochelatase [Chloroflexota bacterium]|nr:bifunctional precorrin-2 dehydrogenase/sirohydrochlorin ferrochelatase [Chloroflexota bacterium]